MAAKNTNVNKQSLIILTPTGRRCTVNVTPNTSILQVLEDVCKKHDLDFNEWDLKHYNRIIEVANSVRFSGLPNNASLEMVQSSKPRKETTITLGLQLESGKRLKQEFLSSENLWDILLHFEKAGEEIFPAGRSISNDPNSDEIQPVCIYMRQEIVGEEQLQKTTLRSLGLTHGTACIRLIHRLQSQLKQQANVSAPLSRQTTSDPNLEAPDTYREEQHGDKNLSQPQESMRSTPGALNSFTAQVQPIDLKRKGRFPSPPQPSLPENEPMQVEDTVEVNHPTTISQDNSGGNSSNQINEDYNPVLPQSRLAPEGQLNIIGEHDACLYFSGDVSRPSQSALDVDDSFFELTERDVRRRYLDLQAKIREMNEAPLVIGEVRALQREELQRRMLEEHPMTVVRIRFPNGYILQGTFFTTDTIGTVATFVKNYLADSNLDFYLLKTPPRTILSSDSRLLDLDLVGSAVIYFGSNTTQNGGNYEYLKPDIYAQLSCPNAIKQHVRNRLQSLLGTTAPSPSIPSGSHSLDQASQVIGNQEQEVHPTPTAARNTRESNRKVGQNSGAVPKWFRK